MRMRYKQLLDLYKDDQKDSLALLFERLFKWAVLSFGVTYTVFLGFFKDTHPDLVIIPGIFWGLIPIFFIAVGIRVTGIRKGISGFSHQLLHVLGNTFKYLLLPALVISLLIILYLRVATGGFGLF